MEKVRAKFFEGVENVPSFERFVEFYRWIDHSLSTILDQFVPASAKRFEGIRNIVESHDLERNKYWTKFPTLEKKAVEPQANILGINELTYDWEHGHAPVPTSGEAATATIATTGAPGNDETFTLTDATGLAVTYVFKTAVATVDGTKDGDNVIIGVNGAIGSPAAVGDRIRAAIGASDIKMSVTETNAGQMLLKQLAVGKAGNTQIDMSGVTTTTSTNFSGGVDIQVTDNVNCLWQKERATRTKDNKVSAEVDSSRETIRRVGNTDVSGSTYAIRRLTRPYKLSAGFQHVLHAGDNFHLNKKKDFFKATTNPGSEDFIAVTASNINVDTCPDVHIPKYRLEGGQVYEKKRFGGEANISNTNRDHDINTVLPFSLYTSSVDAPTDYKAFIFDNFKQGDEVTNLHNDAYGDDRELPIQGPFHDHHVGGHFHRHVAMNRGENLDRRGDRREAFFISASHGQLYVLNPDMEGQTGPENFNVSFTGSYAGRVNFMREPLAKRPVNIRNIKTTTGSVFLGNYQRDYEIVLGTSQEMSKDHLLENSDKLFSVQQPSHNLNRFAGVIEGERGGQVYAADHVLSSTGSFSTSTWFYMEFDHATVYFAWKRHEDAIVWDHANQQFEAYLKDRTTPGDGATEFAIRKTAQEPPGLTFRKWHNLVMTYQAGGANLAAQASNIKLYIDGVDVSGITDTTGSNPIAENIDDTQPYRILYLPR